MGAVALVRPSHLVAGLAAHLLAIGSMVWFAGFLGGLVVPKTIDSGASGPLGAALAVDLALLLSFGAAHSLLARERVKRWLARGLPPPLVRSFFSALAGLQIVALCLLWRPLPDPVWALEAGSFPGAGLAVATLWALFFGGWALVLAALWAIGDRHLFGLAEAAASARGESYRPPPFAPKGIYRVIRHPLYTGTLLPLWAAPVMSRGHLLLATVLTLYLAIGSIFEERDLRRRLGDAYLGYRARVPGFLPRVR